jgi:peptide/nickel transport system permease protein
MTGFLARRLANYVLLCLVATFLAFALASLTFSPLGQLQGRNPPPPASVIEAKRAELRLDEPIPTRFAAWMGGVVGVASVIRQYRASDYAATLFSFLVLSTPVFLIGTLLKFGGLQLNETAGTTVLYFTGEFSPGFQGSWWAAMGDRLSHLVLPTLAIALTQIAYYSRYQRSAMLDVLGSDFLRTAQAKGLTRRRALFKHGLRTALIPMATLFAFGFGLLITGGVFTERIFGWYGMGDWFVYGITQNDTNIVATVTLFVAVLVLFSGWLSDVLYAALDPRIRI